MSRLIEKPELQIVASKDHSLAQIVGRIDVDSSPVLRAHLLLMLQAPPRQGMSIDLSAVTHIESSGLATLIEALKIARSQNIELKLQGLQGRLLHLFQSTGILSLFTKPLDGNKQLQSRAV